MCVMLVKCVNESMESGRRVSAPSDGGLEGGGLDGRRSVLYAVYV